MNAMACLLCVVSAAPFRSRGPACPRSWRSATQSAHLSSPFDSANGMRTGVWTRCEDACETPWCGPIATGRVPAEPDMESRDPLPLGELVRRHRTAAMLSQEQLAERAGLSVRAISDLVARRPSRPPARNRADAGRCPRPLERRPGSAVGGGPSCAVPSRRRRRRGSCHAAAAARDAVGWSRARGGSAGRHAAPWRCPPPDADRPRWRRQDATSARVRGEAAAAFAMRSCLVTLTPSATRRRCCRRCRPSRRARYRHRPDADRLREHRPSGDSCWSRTTGAGRERAHPARSTLAPAPRLYILATSRVAAGADGGEEPVVTPAIRIGPAAMSGRLEALEAVRLVSARARASARLCADGGQRRSGGRHLCASGRITARHRAGGGARARCSRRRRCWSGWSGACRC